MPDASAKATETVFALATPSLPGRAAMVRISGPLAPAILDTPWMRRSLHTTLQLGVGPVPCIAWQLPAPRTLTGQDLLELYVPGNPEIVRELLDWLATKGCREAEPGEFTRLAVLSGKMSLNAAQATLALVMASDEAARRNALSDLQGQTARTLREATERLRALSARFEMTFDFSEEEHAHPEQDRLAADLRCLQTTLEQLVGEEQSRTRPDTPTVALFGPPNAGKSSLFNALLRQPHALVSALPGTTRDAVERPATFGDSGCVLIDLSGVGQGDTDAGRFAGASRQQAVAADLLLVLSAPGQGPVCAREFLRLTGQDPTLRARAIWVHSMSDLAAQPPNPCGIPEFSVSVASGRGLEELRVAIRERLAEIATGGIETLMRTRMRGAMAALHRALSDPHTPPEAVAADVRRALVLLDEALMSDAPGDVLDLIFSRFCIGK